jgi:hypothetical protein
MDAVSLFLANGRAYAAFGCPVQAVEVDSGRILPALPFTQ